MFLTDKRKMNWIRKMDRVPNPVQPLGWVRYEGASHHTFPLLESLILKELEKLQEVWHDPISTGSFSNLKTLARAVFISRIKIYFLTFHS